MGLLISSYLCEHHDVTIYVRNTIQKERLNDNGLHLVGFKKSLPVRALLLEEIRKAECYIICVKQHHIKHILQFLNQVDQHTPLFFLQNGMGHLRHIDHMNNPLLVGVVEHGALREGANTVRHTGKGSIKVAAYNVSNERLFTLIKQLHRDEFPIENMVDWNRLLAEKLIINAVINPLTALFDVTNGQIITNPYIRTLARKLCQEASFTLELNDELQWKRIQKIAHQTKRNISSMLMDIRKGQETENEAISGYLIKSCQEDLPYTSFVYNSIKALEINKGMDRYDH